MTRIRGLIAAPFTPMDADGAIALAVIPAYAAKLKEDGIAGVFVNGTTGEGHSLSSDERYAQAEAWIRHRTEDFRVIINTGHTALPECIAFARHAEHIGADAVGLMPPNYFKPSTVEDLVRFCTEVASACPATPAYYYHIPSFTGVSFPMIAFLTAAEEAIPNLTGIKFTYENIMDYAQCLSFRNGAYDMVFGRDELLLSSLVVGAQGAIGSTYNFAAHLYHGIMEAFAAGNVDSAREGQAKAVEMISVLNRYGGLAAGKAIMKMSGIDCGPVRSPLHSLSHDSKKSLFEAFTAQGLFLSAAEAVI